MVAGRVMQTRFEDGCCRMAFNAFILPVMTLAFAKCHPLQMLLNTECNQSLVNALYFHMVSIRVSITSLDKMNGDTC